jgi:hypothetical protein
MPLSSSPEPRIHLLVHLKQRSHHRLPQLTVLNYRVATRQRSSDKKITFYGILKVKGHISFQVVHEIHNTTGMLLKMLQALVASQRS